MSVIKDVARLADVSVGTVSKYLNNPDRLKDATRQKVEAAVNELQYTPSALARSMRTGKTHTIAIIAPNITNPFFAEVYNSIRLNAVNKGYTPILFTIEDDLKTLESYFSSISRHQVDGLILCFVDEDELIETFIEQLRAALPIVLLSWDIHNERFNCVCIDVFEGTYKSTNYLISLGYKNIAYAGGYEKNRISSQKFNGYSKAMKDARLEINSEFIYHGDLNLKTGYYAARKFSMLPTLPDALVADNDIIGIGSMKYFAQRKIRVPEDIAVIGFDNIMLSAIYDPALSTVSLPINKMGEESVRLLTAVIDKPNSKNKLVILKSELIIRNSTDKNAPIELEF
jgi:DNA-binding LacI/PurR family transcriptional regulator